MPKKPDSNQIIVRFKDDELTYLKKQAEERAISRQHIIRELVRDKMNGSKGKNSREDSER